MTFDHDAAGDATPSGHRLPAGLPVIAHEAGGTVTKSMLVDGTGTILDTRYGPTRGPVPERTEHAVDDVRAELGRRHAQLVADHPQVKPERVGVVVPGIVDEPAQVARYSANLGWRDLPLSRLLRNDLGLDVVLGHDVRAGTRAEYEIGAAQGVDEVTVMIIGTGITAGIVTGAQLVRAEGYAGEVGHAVILPGGPPCGCGGRGHLEAIASAGAIARRYQESVGEAVDGARGVLQLQQAGNPVATRIWADATDALAIFFCVLAASLSPHLVVIGGGLAAAGDELLDPIRTRMQQELTFQRVPELRISGLADDAGVLGAAFLARG